MAVHAAAQFIEGNHVRPAAAALRATCPAAHRVYGLLAVPAPGCQAALPATTGPPGRWVAGKIASRCRTSRSHRTCGDGASSDRLPPASRARLAASTRTPIPAAPRKVTPDMSTARWASPPLIAAMRKRRMAGAVAMSISPSRTTVAEGRSETTVMAMAPCFHDGVTGEVQTACASEPTPGGRELATPGGRTGPGPARPSGPGGMPLLPGPWSLTGARLVVLPVI